MEGKDEYYFERLMNLIYQKFEEVVIIRKDITPQVFILEVNCIYKSYRVVISEIVDLMGRKYAFYILKDNSIIVGFDNSPDYRAIKLKYEEYFKHHYYERVPHQHTSKKKGIYLTKDMRVEDFIEWLEQELENYLKTC
ncbi:MAG: hypothetical protein AB1567_00740 [bacterium]